MQHIVLSDEQLRILGEAGKAIEARDSQGQTVGTLTPLEPWEVAAIARHKSGQGGRRIPSEQVQAHLKRLGEIHDSDGMDEAKMRDLLRRMLAGETV